MFHGKGYLLDGKPINFYLNRFIEADDIEEAIALGKTKVTSEIDLRADLEPQNGSASIEVDESSELEKEKEKTDSPGFIFYSPETT